jgi:hypothetical protein
MIATIMNILPALLVLTYTLIQTLPEFSSILSTTSFLGPLVPHDN